jgi:penicillin-binding protein 2
MSSFFERRYIIAGIFITLSVILLARLFYIQIIDDRYALWANSNARRTIIKYPARGPILDRNGKVLVTNVGVYDLMITPRQVKPFDTVELCKLLNIDKAEFDKRFEKAYKQAPNTPTVFEKQLPLSLYASLTERISEFLGFNLQPRTVRTYPDSVAAQFLGYIGEANDRDIKRSGGYYRPGDYVGVTGVERSYDTVLRGQRGVSYVFVDAHNVQKGSFGNGALDTLPVPGKRLISSLDIRIQKLGEKLMQGKVGSIVAIEPSTGEILAFVSSPTYDPNLLVGRERGNNIAKMYENTYSPLLDRPIQAYYPPGSSFKPLAALIALQEGLITPQTSYYCTATFWAGNHPVHCEEKHFNTNLSHGIAMSCNTYFCNVFEKVMNAGGASNIASTFTNWKAKVNKFGFGVKLDVDLPNEGRGFVPTSLYYDNKFKNNRWRSTSIISLAIGQGELEATPLQLANIECTIANKGFYYKPHLIKAVGDKAITKEEFTTKTYVGIDSNFFTPVIDGMQQVVETGTAAGSKIPGIVMCGKTGTAQNPHGKNHSLFVAFAPRDHPKIAIAVIVENSGQGAWWAAPIASMIVEKYLKDSVTVNPRGQTPRWYAEQNLMPAPIIRLPAKDAKKLQKDTLKKGAKDSTRKGLIMKSAAAKPVNDSSVKYLTAKFRRKENE